MTMLAPLSMDVSLYILICNGDADSHLCLSFFSASFGVSIMLYFCYLFLYFPSPQYRRISKFGVQPHEASLSLDGLWESCRQPHFLCLMWEYLEMQWASWILIALKLNSMGCWWLRLESLLQISKIYQNTISLPTWINKTSWSKWKEFYIKLCRPIVEVSLQKTILTIPILIYYMDIRTMTTIVQGRIIIEHRFEKKGCGNLRLSLMSLSGSG